MLARSFLIKSSGKLLVTRTGIKVQSSLILGQIRRLILELLALEQRKFHTFELEYLWSQFANLDQFLCVASLGWGKDCIRFWGRLTLAHWIQVSNHCPLGYLFIEPVHNLQNDLFIQHGLRSAWASTQSDQSCLCLHGEALGPCLPIKCIVKTLGRCSGWSESSLSAQVILLVLTCCGSIIGSAMCFYLCCGTYTC